MILVGMLDSPFVRRVAVTMRLLGLSFEHRNWSIGRDQALIRTINPLGRVPTLVLDDGEVLCESGAILDHLDQVSGDRALLPLPGPARRQALQIMALATGAAEKAVAQLYERVFRPAPMRYEPWVARCREQMEGALGELEKACAARGGAWLVGETLTQADVTVACVYTFASEALAFASDRYPALAALAARCEAMPAFAELREPFFPPQG